MLPVLQGDPYRAYPTRLARQEDFADERSVCSHCLSGACCSSEDPIALGSLDVLRLATALDISPVTFLLQFTQDHFAAHCGPERYRERIDAPDSSVVTFLRRRSEHPTSPCIFLKYIRDEDGTCRRICSVHAARPLACREYHYDTCKKRVAGELATMQSEGLEMLRDNRITAEEIERRRRELEAGARGPSLAITWQYAFWSEMRRAADIAAANEEGAAGFDISAYQDPVDEKVNRLLSKRNLRFEEKYGPVAHAEQLDAFEAGTSFRQSPDRERVLRLVQTPPRLGLFGRQDYPHYVGLRTLLPGVSLNVERRSETDETGDWSSPAAQVARGWSFLLALARHAEAVHEPPELSPPGTFQLALLEALLPFGASLQRRIAGAESLEPMRRHLADTVADHLEHRCKAMIRRRTSIGSWLRLYESVATLDGGVSFPRLRRAIQAMKMHMASARVGPRERAGGTRADGIAELWRVRAGESIFSPHAVGRTSLALLEVAVEYAMETDLHWTFELLDTYVRHGRSLCAPVRRRVAEMAVECGANAGGSATVGPGASPALASLVHSAGRRSGGHSKLHCGDRIHPHLTGVRRKLGRRLRAGRRDEHLAG